MGRHDQPTEGASRMSARSTKPARGRARPRDATDEHEQKVLNYLAYMESPVSIDTLTTLSEISSLNVLRAMERLRRKRTVREEREHGKGIYFFDKIHVAGLIKERFSEGRSGENDKEDHPFLSAVAGR